MQQQYFNIPVKLLIILLLSIAIPATLVAQNAAFVTKGKIEFERSVNSYVLMEKAMSFEGSENSSWRDQMLAQYKKNNPQFQLSKFTLLFNDNKSLYGRFFIHKNLLEISVLSVPSCSETNEHFYT